MTAVMAGKKKYGRGTPIDASDLGLQCRSVLQDGRMHVSAHLTFIEGERVVVGHGRQVVLIFDEFLINPKYSNDTKIHYRHISFDDYKILMCQLRKPVLDLCEIYDEFLRHTPVLWQGIDNVPVLRMWLKEYEDVLLLKQIYNKYSGKQNVDVKVSMNDSVYQQDVQSFIRQIQVNVDNNAELSKVQKKTAKEFLDHLMKYVLDINISDMYRKLYLNPNIPPHLIFHCTIEGAMKAAEYLDKMWSRMNELERNAPKDEIICNSIPYAQYLSTCTFIRTQNDHDIYKTPNGDTIKVRRVEQSQEGIRAIIEQHK